jgi:glycosyltransferase involved in cell wall biosynthesis
MRFLFHHASAYAGFVDSSWQPAGWTVACESLASGLPIIMYEGLVSRELIKIGISSNLLYTIAPNDISAFTNKLTEIVSHRNYETKKQAAHFANQHLDFKITAPFFVREIEKLITLK